MAGPLDKGGSKRAQPNPAVQFTQPAKNAEDTPDSEAEASQPGPRTPFSQFAFSNYSPLASSIIDLARRYARAGRGPHAVASSRSLLVGMLFTGKKERNASSASWLWNSLRQRHQALERCASTHFPALTGLSLNKRPGTMPQDGAEEMTSDFAAILNEAETMARDHSREQRVGARHLLGSLLIPREGEPTNSDKMLREAGVDLTRLRREFVGALERWKLGDAVPAWREVLRVSGDAQDRFLSGYTSDDVAGDDLIGITREVEAMASLAAAWTVEPPLSIGLFGEWGSGKSFFMQKMKERVRQIAGEARRSEVGQRQFGYYKNIVQVEFNAWHYVEGNLWAALVEHIFQNLRVLDTDSDAEIEQRQRKLFTELRQKEATKDAAEKDKAKLEAEHKEKEGKREQLTREQHEAEERAQQARKEAAQKAEEKRTVTARDVFDEVYGSAEVRAELKTALRLSDEQLKIPSEVRAAMGEATQAWSTLREGWRIVAGDRGGWKILILVLAVPAAVALIGWSVSWATGGRVGALVDSLATAISTALGLAATAVAAWKRYSPRLKPVLEAADKLRQTRDRLDRRVETAKQERDERVVELDAQAEQKRQEAAAAELEAKSKALEAQRASEEANTAQRKIEEIRKQIDGLRPERMIASFIQDRASAEDYRKHLGVPALIRRDFEKLSGLFRAQRRKEEEDKDGLDIDGKPVVTADIGPDGKPLPARNDPTVVNRIILYVDDLDRCPPNKVVEVLRAIHLLLAFPLFVVVVAVDARWVRRSLKDQFKLMLSAGDDGTGGGAEKDDDRHDDASPATRRASTDDYLEKIFQVAFWLRPLGDAGCQNLLMNLVPASDTAGPDEKAEANADADRPSPGTNERGTQQAGDATTQNVASPRRGTPAKPVWTPVTARPKTLQITEKEREYMLELAPIIGRSPRAVKRFLNCYRLAKAMLEPEDLEWFAPDQPGPDGEFHATMFLLGMVSGAPELATVILDSLERTDAATPGDWVKEFKENPPEHDDWARIEPMLAALIVLPGLDGMKGLRNAAARVDRFAFTPIRVRPESAREEQPSPSSAQ